VKVRLTTSVAAALLLSGVAVLAAEIKSGPQKGQPVGAFHPLHATGPREGFKGCLV
jgi:hypothetical protein